MLRGEEATPLAFCIIEKRFMIDSRSLILIIRADGRQGILM